MPHTQVDVDRVVTLWSLGGILVSILAHNARDMGSIPVLDTIFYIFITSITLVAETMIMFKL